MSSSDAPSRHVNLWRKPSPRIAPKVYDRLDEIQREVEKLENRRARKGKDFERFRNCLRALCLDLFHGYATNPNLEIGISKGRSALSQNPMYPVFVAARPFLAACTGLTVAGYLEELSIGNEGSGKTTRIRATERLLEKLRVGSFSETDLLDTDDTIRLKVSTGRRKADRKREKKRVGFDDTSDTRRWRRNVEIINENNNHFFISLDQDAITRETERNRYTENAARRLGVVDFSATRLHRSFSSRDFQEGGRFFGGWWQIIPRGYRKYIKINRKDTCEYDFSTVHPKLLYAAEGISWSPDYDPYSAPFGRQHRSTVKSALNAILNAKSMPDPVPEFLEAETGMTWQEFVQGIKREHSAIAMHFFSGIGTKLQRKEADIAEAILLKFAEMRYPCLPVHDSFITYTTLGDEMPGIMKEVAKATFGVELEVKPKEVSQSAVIGGAIDDDIATLLQPQSDEDQHWLEFQLRQENQ
jgi:hypothetical protein